VETSDFLAGDPENSSNKRVLYGVDTVRKDHFQYLPNLSGVIQFDLHDSEIATTYLRKPSLSLSGAIVKIGGFIGALKIFGALLASWHESKFEKRLDKSLGNTNTKVDSHNSNVNESIFSSEVLLPTNNKPKLLEKSEIFSFEQL
jgi:ABC-type antimicrobial peptide transport system permease subunit